MVDFKGNPYNEPVYLRSTGLNEVPMRTIDETLCFLSEYEGEIEMRTTIVRDLNDSPSDISAMASILRERLGANVKYVLQQGITDESMDSTLHGVEKLTREEMYKLTYGAAHYLNNVYIRTEAHGEERSMNLR
jgi:pyruvate-formate lyase-activating enzyme